MVYQGIAIGGNIYSFRAAKGMTQEQVAAGLCISPAAVSKWERNLSYPSLEMLWALADLFACSVDELIGRNLDKLKAVGNYEDERLRLVEIGNKCLECTEIARQKGLLALEEAVEYYEGSRFLCFAVKFFLQCLRKNMQLDLVFRLLNNYVETLPEEEQAEGKLITECIQMIVSGEQPALIWEVIASHIGLDYWELKNIDWMKPREEIIEKYKEKAVNNLRGTNPLDILSTAEDFQIQVILRNVDNRTLAAALYGASGQVVCKFLSNLSDRILNYVSQDIENWNGTEQEILEAQRKILEIKARCFPDSI